MGWSWHLLVRGGRVLVMYDVGKEVVVVGGGDGGGVRPNKAMRGHGKNQAKQRRRSRKMRGGREAIAYFSLLRSEMDVYY